MESLKITLLGEAKPRQSANGFDSYLEISLTESVCLEIRWTLNYEFCTAEMNPGKF